MCYICNCFGWALDMLQRIITFMLACVLMSVMCTGMAVAIAAGIAYGYNYSMAEFLTFTRQDVTVYMRRGQFYDKPDVDLDRDLMNRRSNDEIDMFGQNKTLDYQDVSSRSDAQALPAAWKQVKDTKTYAEVLTKYSGKVYEDKEKHQMSPDAQDAQVAEDVSVLETVTRTPPRIIQYPASTTPPNEITPFKTHIMSSFPTTRLTFHTPPSVQTAQVRSGTTQIVMRKFFPLGPKSYPQTTTLKIDNLLYQDADYLPLERHTQRVGKVQKITVPPDIKVILEDQPKSRPYIPIREWGTTVKRDIHDYSEEVDEDSVVYEAV